MGGQRRRLRRLARRGGGLPGAGYGRSQVRPRTRGPGEGGNAVEVVGGRWGCGAQGGGVFPQV